MAKQRPKWQTPGVVFQPRVYEGMKNGINTLVDAIRPTLGPIHRTVLVQKESKLGKPEMLDDGAVIARRIIQLNNREEDMGAMYLRHVLWRLHETAGDGTATAAVMFQVIFREGVRYASAGGNAMLLRPHLEAASRIITEELEKHVFRIEGKEALTGLAETICYDRPLAKKLGEIFDTIGEYGRLEIRPGRGRELEREYVEGMYWNGGISSRAMVTDPTQGRAQLENAAVLITDLDIQEAQDLLPSLDVAKQAGFASLLFVASTLSERALATLIANRERIQVVAVKAPALDAITRSEALADLALLTGGRAFIKAAGDTLSSVRPVDLGQARRAWADSNNFGIVGGKGDPRRLRQHIVQLRSAFARVDDPKDRKRLLERIGKLVGGSAVLWIGGISPIAIEARKAIAERTAEAMRGAIREGVVPGGGTAFLACQPLLQAKFHAAADTDERMAYSILLKVMEAPTRALLENAGFNAEKVLAQLDADHPGDGFDVLQGKVVNMKEAGIVDSASAVKSAAFSAIHGAALALTVDALVHRRNPPSAHSTT